jgi:hypothetical protein
MEALNMDKIDLKHRQTGNIVLCPACGSVMSEVDRLKEGGHIFVWFECGRDNCGGQWLQKKPLYTMARSMSLSAEA